MAYGKLKRRAKFWHRDKTSFITELVAWIGEQGKGWMDNLLSSDGLWHALCWPEP